MDGERQRIVVTIDPVGDPLHGTVQRAGEAAVEFVGYVQLISQLERSRGEAGGERAPDREDDG